jgi:stage II sporulation protein D
MRILSSICLCALTFAPATASARGESKGPLLRIGLVGRFGAPAALTLAAAAGARIHAGALDQRVDEKSCRLRVSPEGGQVKVEDADGTLLARSATVLLSPNEAGEPVGGGPSPSANELTRSRLSSRGRATLSASRKRDGLTRYRGELEITAKAGGGLRVVNVVPLEEYVRGVVALEIGADAPAEALKAQAVAARTYALKSKGRFAKQGYDLTDTTASQAYGGVDAESPATDRSVQETVGLVLMKDGSLILADYYDDCGGVTAPGEDDSDFPPSVVDADDGKDFCATGRSHTWTLDLSAQEANRIARGLARWPSGAKVTNIEVQQADESGRARTVRFTDEDGKPHEIRGTALRALVGNSRLKSTLIKVSKTDGGFAFEGRGYGHGRGMCQAGAIGMASAPYNRSFREILGHYFPGATIDK